MKILLLILSCNEQFFKDELELCKQTWVSNISKYDDIQWFAYVGSDRNYIDYNNHLIYTDCGDDIDNLFLKTQIAFKLTYNIDYDYLVRVNTSTYVNIDALYKICLKGFDCIYCPEIIRCAEYDYGTGKLLMFKKEYIKYINDTENINGWDDVEIGKIMKLHSIPFNTIKGYLIFKNCPWHYLWKQNLTLSDLHNSLYIAFKSYTNDRYNEFEWCKRLHNILKDYIASDENITEMMSAKQIAFDTIQNKFILL